jgi:ABC-2 type transport system ATP-binding protein
MDTSAMSPLPLVVENARKTFGAVTALELVSVEVGPGELVGLLGPNGAGKTTLIRAIGGRLALDSGSVRVFGRELSVADPRPELGVVPQELAVYPLLTARENLEVFGRLYGVPAADVRERVQWALAWSGLEERAGESAKRFSGGMKRRLNIACSLVHKPRLVLLDEPTVGVDPQSRERIYEMLDSLRAAGVSVVLTTHHLEEAEQRCERIVIIDRGSIVAAGTPAELAARTVGASCTVRVALNASLPDAIALPEQATLSADRRVIQAPLADLDRDLRLLLDVIRAAGVAPTDVDTRGVSLQDVFISLTGRELRE